MAIRDIKTADFEAATASGVSLVDFWAPWCGPCKMQGAIIESKIVPAHPGLNVLKVDIDAEPDLAVRFGIMSIPTVLVIKDGKVAKQFVGVTSPDELMAAVQGA